MPSRFRDVKTVGFQPLTLEASNAFVLISIVDCSFNPETIEEKEAVDSPQPSVFVLYYPENDLYQEQIESFVNELRQEFSIDCYTKFSSKEYDINKQVFVFNSLQKADFVFVFCSPAFKIAEKHKSAKTPQPSGISFIFTSV